MGFCQKNWGLFALLLFFAAPSMAEGDSTAVAPATPVVDSSAVTAAPSAVPADTAPVAGAGPETLFVADTSAVKQDSSSAPADTAVAVADTSAATPDSASAPVDSAVAVADTSAAKPDSASAPVDTAVAVTDSSAAKPDSVSAPADTAVAKMDSAAVKPDTAAAPVDSAAPPQPATTATPRKRFFFGVFGAVTYNDFYDSELGLSNMGKNASGSTVRTSGQDGLMGNYWRFGANAGIAAMYMFNDMFGLHAEMGVAYRKGKGESDVTVTLIWDDKSKPKERASLGIEYSLKQINMDIPLFARFTLPNVFFVEAGPMLSLNFNSRYKSYVTDDESTQKYREEDVCNFAEFDAAFGLGATRRIGSKSIEAGLRFVLGITPLSDADDAPKTWQGQFNLTFWFL